MDKKKWKNYLFIYTWENLEAKDYSTPNKFSSEPKLKVISLKKYYDDLYIDRRGKFNYLKRYKGMYAVEIVTAPNISKVKSKDLIRLKIPNSGEKGFRFIESGYGTFVVKSPGDHLTILERYNHKVGIKVIPKLEYPENIDNLIQVVLIQTKELVYYLYLYKSYSSILKEDENGDDEENSFQLDFINSEMFSLPHF